jgi:hypothetical protein
MEVIDIPFKIEMRFKIGLIQKFQRKNEKIARIPDTETSVSRNRNYERSHLKPKSSNDFPCGDGVLVPGAGVGFPDCVLGE